MITRLLSWSQDTKLIDVASEPDPDVDSAIADYSIEDASGRYLALLVLEQASHDAVGDYDTSVRKAARWYLTNDTPDLRFICAIARVSHRYLIEQWTKRLGGVEPLPDRKKMFDFLKKEKRYGRSSSPEPNIPRGLESGDLHREAVLASATAG